MDWYQNPKAGVKKPILKGDALMIVLAGTNEGFIKNGLLMFKSERKTGDFHDKMNSSNYIKWLNNELIPNLPNKSLLVLDSLVKNILQAAQLSQKQLSERNIQVDAKLTEPELFKLIKPLNDKGKIYKDSTIYKYTKIYRFSAADLTNIEKRNTTIIQITMDSNICSSEMFLGQRCHYWKRKAG